MNKKKLVLNSRPLTTVEKVGPEWLVTFKNEKGHQIFTAAYAEEGLATIASSVLNNVKWLVAA